MSMIWQPDLFFTNLVDARQDIIYRWLTKDSFTQGDLRMRLTDAKSTAQEVSVHEQTLRELAKSGKIPCYRLGPRTLRFNVEELKRHMKKNAKRHGK